MSAYFKQGKGWRYDFTQKGTRHTEAWFKTKKEAKEAEARKRQELKNPPPEKEVETTLTDTAFGELLNRRLDYVKAYHSERHYRDYLYYARRWVKKWGTLSPNDLITELVEKYILERRKISAKAANREIRYLRATFNFLKKKKFIAYNPTEGIDFFPEEKTLKYVPVPEDIDRVIAVADREVQDYLLTIRDTMGRMGEVNRLTWNDVNLEQRFVVLYTRKKKGGNLTPRKVAMTQRLHEALSRRHEERDDTNPWVFWHTYFDLTGKKKTGPYRDRHKIMRSLCRKAGVKYFRFHALRHASASVLDQRGARLGDIQRILGHENRRTTEIYLHSIGDDQREAIATLEQSPGKILTQSLTQAKKRLGHLT
jgi:integrase